MFQGPRRPNEQEEGKKENKQDGVKLPSFPAFLKKCHSIIRVNEVCKENKEVIRCGPEGYEGQWLRAENRNADEARSEQEIQKG